MAILMILLALAFIAAFLFRIGRWIVEIIYELAPWVILFAFCAIGYLYFLKVDNGRNIKAIENQSRCSSGRAEQECLKILSKTSPEHQSR